MNLARLRVGMQIDSFGAEGFELTGSMLRSSILSWELTQELILLSAWSGSRERSGESDCRRFGESQRSEMGGLAVFAQ